MDNPARNPISTMDNPAINPTYNMEKPPTYPISPMEKPTINLNSSIEKSIIYLTTTDKPPINHNSIMKNNSILKNTPINTTSNKYVPLGRPRSFTRYTRPPKRIPAKRSKRKFEPAGFNSLLVETFERDIVQKDISVKWQDIASLGDAKNLIQEDILLSPKDSHSFCGIQKNVKGILMVGPSGTGMTLLAKAVATECDTVFLSVALARLSSLYNRDAQLLIRLVFEMAKFHAPSTIFIDEIDAFCSKRGQDTEVRRKVKAELLTQMDGVSEMSTDHNNLVILITATNSPWYMDDDLLVRLEKRIHIPLPDARGREILLNINLRDIALNSDVNIAYLAKQLEGYTGSDIRNVCRDAAMMALRRHIVSLKPELVSPEKKRDIDLTTGSKDFEESISYVMKSVSTREVIRYRDWMDAFGSI